MIAIKDITNPKEYWNSVADQIKGYDEEWLRIGMVGNQTWFHEYGINKLGRLIFELLPDNEYKNILDVGCGIGQWSTKLSDKLNSSVIGIDISPEMIELARKRSKILENSSTKFFLMNAKDLKFEDDFFDLVICVTVLMHTTDEKTWGKTIKEIVKVTKPGGFILIFEDAPTEHKGERGWDAGYVRLESEYISKFREERAKFIEKIIANNPFSSLILGFGEKLLYLYATKVNKKKPDFYSKDFSRYKPKVMYLPCMFLIMLATMVDSLYTYFPILGRKAYGKIMLFKKENR